MVIVEYINHKKILDYKLLNDEYIKNIFNIPKEVDIFAQYYNPTICEYIDVDNFKSLDENCKLRVLLEQKIPYLKYEEIKSLKLSQSSDHVSDSSSQCICSNPKSSIVNTKFEPDMTEESDMKVQIDDILIKSEEECINPEIIIVNDNTHKKRIYNYFDWDNYTLPESSLKSRLSRSLARKDILTKFLKSMLLTEIYEDLNTGDDKLYMTGKFKIIATAILKKFPHLQGHMNYEEAKKSWAVSLCNKFQNERRNKRNKIKDETGVPVPIIKPKTFKSQSKYFDVPNDISHTEETTDDKEAEIEHVSFIVSELKKGKPNAHEISLRMRLTFDRRRNFIVNGKNVMSDIIEKYPALCLEYEFIMEVKRLFNNINYLEQYYIFKDVFSKKIATVMKNYKSKNLLVLDELFDQYKIKNIDDITNLYMIGSICYVLRENPLYIMGDKTSNGTPFLKVHNMGASLFIDGKCILKNITCASALFLWTASFVVFGLEISPELSKTYNFCLSLFFNIDCNSRMKSLQGMISLHSILSQCRET